MRSPGRWLVFDDVPTGHHPGYLNGVVGGLVQAGVRPIVAGPEPPESLSDPADWIQTRYRPLRAVAANRRQLMRIVADAERRGADTFIDLFLDKNVWAAGGVGALPHRVHILHHASQYDLEARHGAAAARTRFLRHRLRRLAERGAMVVVHTPRAAEILGDGVPAERLRIVGYPVVAPRLRPEGIRSGPPVLLFTGAGRPEKGLDRLIHAMSYLESDAELRVVGLQPSAILDSLGSTPGPITWVNRRVTDQELWAEYQAASIAVLPYNRSFGEHGGPSSVLLEVLGRGIPVVTTAALAPQLPSAGGAVVAESDSPRDLAAAIDSAVDRLAELTSAARQTGPDFVARNHSFTAYSDALREVARR